MHSPIDQQYGFSASSSSNVLSISSPSISNTDYFDTTGQPVVIVSQAQPIRLTEHIFSASTNAGDIITLTVFDSGLSGGQESVSYTVQPNDNLTNITQGLSIAINADTNLQANGVSSLWSGITDVADTQQRFCSQILQHNHIHRNRK